MMVYVPEEHIGELASDLSAIAYEFKFHKPDGIVLKGLIALMDSIVKDLKQADANLKAKEADHEQR